MSIAYSRYTAPADYVITLASLAAAAARQSDEYENTNGWDDVFVLAKITSGVGAAGYVNLWAYSRIDTLRSEGAGAADAAITLSNPPNLVLLGRVSIPAGSTTYYSQLFSIAQAFGGKVPRYHGIVVQNALSGAFGALAGDFAVKRYGMYYELL